MKNDFDSRVRENSSMARTGFEGREDNPPFNSQVGAPPLLDQRRGAVTAENESVMSPPSHLDPVAPSSGAHVRVANAFATVLPHIP
jgi:hypothetical protein